MAVLAVAAFLSGSVAAVTAPAFARSPASTDANPASANEWRSMDPPPLDAADSTPQATVDPSVIANTANSPPPAADPAPPLEIPTSLAMKAVPLAPAVDPADSVASEPEPGQASLDHPADDEVTEDPTTGPAAAHPEGESDVGDTQEPGAFAVPGNTPPVAVDDPVRPRRRSRS